ncbi:MAG: LysR family transcriptional regulator [Limosilactobacillus sp.]
MKIFQAVAECLNFSKAAEKLYMTQPTVSKRVHILEQKYQVRLFNRNYHNLQLTDSGKIFYRYAKKMLALNSGLINELNKNQLDNLPFCKVRVGLFITNGTKSIINKFSDFNQEHPNIQIEFSNMMSDEVIGNVINKNLDIGIGIVEPHLEIGWEPLFSDEFVIVRDRTRSQTNELDRLRNKMLLAMPIEAEDPLTRKIITNRKHSILRNIDEIVTNLLVQDSYAILSKDVVKNLKSPDLTYKEIKDYPRNNVSFMTGLVYRLDNTSPVVQALIRYFSS